MITVTYRIKIPPFLKIMPVHKMVLVYVLDIILFGYCLPGQTMKRKERIDDLYTYKKRAVYESNHMENYVNAPEQYEEWPELTNEDDMEICQKYVGTVFSEAPRTILTTHTSKVKLHYREIEDISTRRDSTLVLRALHCQIFPPFLHRKFVHFVKSPTPDCLYLCCFFNTSSRKHYIIIEEVCLGRTYIAWKIWSCDKFKKKRNKRVTHHERRYDDDAQSRKEYEINHFRDYKLKKTEYGKWPTMERNDLLICCQVLTEQLFPKSKYTEFIGKALSIKLKYMEIKNKENSEFQLLKVGALQCQVPQKKQRNYFDVIRAPRSDCVYLIKKSAPISSVYYIAKQICEGQELHRKHKTIKHSNSEIGISIDEYLINLFDEELEGEDI